MKIYKILVLSVVVASHYYLPKIAYCISIPMTLYFANYVFHIWHDWSKWRNSTFFTSANKQVLSQERQCNVCGKKQIQQL